MKEYFLIYNDQDNIISQFKANIIHNKVEYIIDAGMLFKTEYGKLQLSMRFFSIKIITHHFQVDNSCGELGIGYDIVIIK